MTASAPTRAPLRAAILASATALALAAPLGAARAATAPVPLPQDKHVITSLTAARVADQIRHACPTISGRIIHAYFKAQQLYNYAIDQGHSGAEIRAFLKDKQQKTRIKKLASDYITAHHARPDNAASMCALGQQEMAKNTIAGDLLSKD